MTTEFESTKQAINGELKKQEDQHLLRLSSFLLVESAQSTVGGQCLRSVRKTSAENHRRRDADACPRLG
jgi:hypothetical protein